MSKIKEKTKKLLLYFIISFITAITTTVINNIAQYLLERGEKEGTQIIQEIIE